MDATTSPERVARGAARGAVAAMAMTGFRAVTEGLGLLDESPPEDVARRGVPSLFARVPPERRREAVQLAHWAYGAAGGAAFGLLPQALRRRAWAGPLYGLAVWLLFEGAVAPLLGLRGRRAAEHVALAADHVLYGLVVAARAARP